MKRWAAFWRAFDLARIFPRVVLCGCAYMTWIVTQWFMALPKPSAEQSAFVVVVYGVIPLILNFYMANGVKWDIQHPAPKEEPK